MSTYILIHGAWLGAWCWDKVVPLLEKEGHRVVVPELPGHGQDQTPIPQISLEAYVDVVTTAIGQQTAPVILVGHSMAGVVISEVAERVPDRIAALIYVAAYLLQSGESILQLSQTDPASLVGPNMQLAPDYSTVGIKAAALKDVFAADAGSEDVERLQQFARPEPAAPFNTPITITAGNFGRVPRRYIQTLQDRAVTPNLQNAMLAKLPCERVLTINTSHTPFFAAPEELAADIITLSAEGQVGVAGS